MKTRLRLSSVLLFVFFSEILAISPVVAAINIMPLGDSITQGSASGVLNKDAWVSYRMALWNLLDADGYDVNFVGSLDNGSAVFGDFQHEGHPGWRDDEIVNGNLVVPDAGNLLEWLSIYQPDIILLHIGTNGLNSSPDDVKAILDVIDSYSVDVWVILARIINRSCITDALPCSESVTTTLFNDNVMAMAQNRIDLLGDKIILVNMENGAGIDYRAQPDGDMWDNLHPFETGYEKMANVWFSGLQAILPVADVGPDQYKYEGNMVALDASNSFDPNGMIVSYFWEQQPGGSPVILSDSTAVKPTFTAPDVGLDGETLTFKVTVTDSQGLESTDTTNIYVSNDNCPDDPNKTEPGVCGCGIVDTDSDGDGIPDCNDNCPNDPNKTGPGICGCGIADIDTDLDGNPDCNDNCPNDPNKTGPGICGCGISDTDSDGDGTVDCQEQGPDGNDPNYDGNYDGTADSLQNNVVSFHTYDDKNYVTMESPVGTIISNFTAEDNPSKTNAPSDVEFPYGFFGFNIDGVGIGGAATVTLYFPTGETFDTYYKYGPTPNNTTNHWYEFLYDGQTGAEISGNVITLHLVDGMRGDDDFTANGFVPDVGAPAIAVKSPGEESGGGGGCFIATAAYGSLMEPHVRILREFRDRFLLGNTVGDNFVRLYYSYSPPIADFIAEHDSLRAMVRISLLPVVGISWIALEIGPVSTVVLMLFVIPCFMGIFCFRQRNKE